MAILGQATGGVSGPFTAANAAVAEAMSINASQISVRLTAPDGSIQETTYLNHQVVNGQATVHVTTVVTNPDGTTYRSTIIEENPFMGEFNQGNLVAFVLNGFANTQEIIDILPAHLQDDLNPFFFADAGVNSFWGDYLDNVRESFQALGNDIRDAFNGDRHFNGISTNSIGDWFGDRDGDGIANIFDTDDGVGLNDIHNEGGSAGLGPTYEPQLDGNGNWTGAIVGTNPDGSSAGTIFPGSDRIFNGGDGSLGGSGGGTPTGDGRLYPVILDLDGDGVEIAVSTSVFFDWDDDGFLEQGSWVSPDDGFLVIDLNEDGTRGEGDNQINQTRELVLSLWGNEGDTDLQAVQRAFDDNSDLVLNNQDAVWSELRVWQDINQNGVSETGELRTLEEWGITEINLTYDGFDLGSDPTDAEIEEMYNATDNDITIFGNTLHGFASFVMNGEKLSNSSTQRGKFEDFIELSLKFLSSPWKIWESGNMTLRRTVLRLVFTERLAYCRNEGYRTPKTTLPFKALAEIQQGKGELVRAGGLEPPRAFAQQILSLVCLPFHHARIWRCSSISVSGLYRA